MPPGLLLGIDPEADYSTTEIPLEPGAVLALYTAGLVETLGVDLDDAMAGLAARLAGTAPRPVDRLATDLIDQACRTAPRTDDIALLLIRFVAAAWRRGVWKAPGRHAGSGPVRHERGAARAVTPALATSSP